MPHWPQRADFLSEHPDMVAKTGQQGIADATDNELKALFSDQEVVKVVRDEPDAARLDGETVHKSARKSAYMK